MLYGLRCRIQRFTEANSGELFMLVALLALALGIYIGAVVTERNTALSHEFTRMDTKATYVLHPRSCMEVE